MAITNDAFCAIGSITENEKEPASISRSNNHLEGKKGAGIEMNDVVNTAKGTVGITFDDNTKVNITENSKLVIDDFVYEPKKGAGSLGLKVALGTVRYTSGVIAHNNPNSVAIKTPTSTIAVRGTDFLMSVDEIGRSMIILLPQCDSMGVCKTGVIDVETPAGIVTMNQANQATMVDSGSNPPTPPIVVNLEGRPLNNTLQVSSPKTASGAAFASEARGQSQKSQQSKNSVSEAEAQVIVAVDQTQKTTPAPSMPTVPDKEEEKKAVPMHVMATYNSAGIIDGWRYENSSSSNKNYTTIQMNADTNVIIGVVQDYVPDAYKMGTGTGGTIIIQQVTK